MHRAFTAAQRRSIRDALARRPVPGESSAHADRRPDPLPCPSCGAPLGESPVPAPPELPYVRHRVMLVCAACELGAAFDVRADARP